MTQTPFPQPQLAETVSEAARAQLAPMIAGGPMPELTRSYVDAPETDAALAAQAAFLARYVTQ